MIEELLNYQSEDANLRKIEVELSNSEARKKAKVASGFLSGTKDVLEKLDLKAKEILAAYEKIKEEQQKLIDQQEEFKKAVEGFSDENEGMFIIKKTDELLIKIRNLEKELVKLSQDAEAISKEYVDVRNKYKAMQAQYNENSEKYKLLKNSKAAEMEKIKQKLDVLAKKVDPEMLKKYLEKRSGIFPVLYEVNGNVCGACNMELSMSDVDKLKNGGIIECEQCRRLLYKK